MGAVCGVAVRGAMGPVLALLVCLGLVTGCASIPAQELKTLGSEIVPNSVDFAALDVEAKRARAAYSTEAQIRSAYPDTVRVATPGKSGVQYFIERDDKSRIQYIVVRGTDDKLNLREDFKIRVSFDEKAGIPVHDGFQSDARAVYADAKPYLKAGYTTRLVGHSLGGAVAAIVGIYATKDGYPVQKIVTFGQPRFTTSKAVATLSWLPLTRVVDENDIIPMLPPATINGMEGTYQQVGPEVILLQGKYYVYLPKHIANRLDTGEFWRELGIADLPDHKMLKYLARLDPKLKGAVEVDYNDRERYSTRPTTKNASAAR